MAINFDGYSPGISFGDLDFADNHYTVSSGAYWTPQVVVTTLENGAENWGTWKKATGSAGNLRFASIPWDGFELQIATNAASSNAGAENIRVQVGLGDEDGATSQDIDIVFDTEQFSKRFGFGSTPSAVPPKRYPIHVPFGANTIPYVRVMAYTDQDHQVRVRLCPYYSGFGDVQADELYQVYEFASAQDLDAGGEQHSPTIESSVSSSYSWQSWVELGTTPAGKPISGFQVELSDPNSYTWGASVMLSIGIGESGSETPIYMYDLCGLSSAANSHQTKRFIPMYIPPSTRICFRMAYTTTSTPRRYVNLKLWR